MTLTADEQMDRDWKLDQRIDSAIAQVLPKLEELTELLNERFPENKLSWALREVQVDLRKLRAQGVRRWD